MTDNDIWAYANQISSTIDNANENWTKEKIANKTNQNNLQIANLNNQADYERWKEQEAYNWAMWNATNAYNSPAHQRKLMEQAGYNPASLFGMNGAANATQMSIGDAPRTHDVQFQPWDFSLQSKYSNMAAMASTRKSNADAISQEIKNIYEGSVKEAELSAMGFENRSKAVKAFVDEETKGTQVNQQKANLASTQTDIELANLQKKRQELEYQIAQVYGWEEAHWRVENLLKDYEQKDSSIDLNTWLADYYKKSGSAALTSAAANYLNAQSNWKNAQTNERVANENIDLIRKNVEKVAAEIHVENGKLLQLCAAIWNMKYERQLTQEQIRMLHNYGGKEAVSRIVHNYSSSAADILNAAANVATKGRVPQVPQQEYNPFDITTTGSLPYGY